MAVILEVLDEQGAVRTRVRVRALPFTIGRAYDNDLILDDPYADAHHARVTLTGDGNVVLEDLGSTNGLVANGSAAAERQVVAASGSSVRVGRTFLRFRDSGEHVPPALPETQPRGARGAWLDRRAVRIAVMVAMPLGVAWWAWLDTYSESPWNEVLAVPLGFAIFGALWAGGWAVAGRLVGGRFRFGPQYAVFSAALLIGLALSAAAEWLAFLFPDMRLYAPFSAVFWFGLLSFFLATHLRYVGSMRRARRWRGAIATVGVLYLLGGAFALAARSTFTDVPSFSGVTKPLGARWVPARSIDAFVVEADDLKDKVDEMAREE